MNENGSFGSMPLASTLGWLTGVRFLSLRTFGSVSLTIAFATSFCDLRREHAREDVARRLAGTEPLDVGLLAEGHVGLVDLGLDDGRRDLDRQLHDDGRDALLADLHWGG